MALDISTRLSSLQFTMQALEEFGGAFLLELSKMLESIGYDLKPEDDWILGYSVQNVITYIKNECNLTTIPEGLYYVAVNRSVGQFLNTLKSSGKLEGFNFETAVKQVQEGDTSITFETSQTPEKSFDALISNLMNYGKSEFASYRSIKW